MNRTLNLAFLTSLVLNLLLLGVILGRVPHEFDSRPTRRERMEEALKELPDAAQARLREKFDQIRATGDPLRDQIDTARNEALRLMSAEPFDETAYDRQVNKIDHLREEMFNRMSQAIKQTIEELSPEERRMFANVLRRPPPTRD